MTKDNAAITSGETTGEPRTSRFLGSLKDALVAAGREDTIEQAKSRAKPAAAIPPAIPVTAVAPSKAPSASAKPDKKDAKPEAEVATIPSAESAARAVRGTSRPLEDRHVESETPPTTRVVKPSSAKPDADSESPARTQLVRGQMKVERGAFELDPVVGWLVVVGGPGIGNYRPIFEGNNTIGRSGRNRIPVDFGDDSISSEEQAYIRYDSSDRSFLFVPNLAKTNVVSVNDRKPTAAVELTHMDVITMGRTQLVFVPFCGQEFDWAALAENTKE